MTAADTRYMLEQVPGMTPGMLDLLTMGTKKMAELEAQVRAMGPANAEAGAAAEAFQSKVADLTLAWYHFGNIALPVVSGLLDLLTGLDNLLGKVTGKHFDLKAFLGLDFVPGSLPDRALNWLIGQGGVGEAHASTGQTPQTGNWTNFLSGLSYLETSQHDSGNTSSSAQGYFQFLRGTAARASGAGIPNTQSGSYQQQAMAAMKYIRQFYPKAAEAIEKGDFAGAAGMLNGEWPSLPGGSQPQSAERYRMMLEEWRGLGPRPPGEMPAGAPAAAGDRDTTNNQGGDQHSSVNSEVHIGEINVNAPNARDADGVAAGMRGALTRNSLAMPANYANV
jgi:hypothetical protein